ncbi:hypothetical protein Droror1_Dr00002608 [Drosera rotundifolia]
MIALPTAFLGVSHRRPSPASIKRHRRRGYRRNHLPIQIDSSDHFPNWVIPLFAFHQTLSDYFVLEIDPFDLNACWIALDLNVMWSILGCKEINNVGLRRWVERLLGGRIESVEWCFGDAVEVFRRNVS